MLDQPDFLNACVAIETDLSPLELLDECKRVERELGREPGGVRHGPRPIDVDVLLLGDLELRTERLTLPHPEITSRRFVLEPLLELDPELALPDGTPLAPLLDGLADQPVRRVTQSASRRAARRRTGAHRGSRGRPRRPRDRVTAAYLRKG